MKKIILGAMLLMLATSTFSQQTNPSPTFTKQDFLKKSKTQKTIAFSLLGGGLVMGGIGILAAFKEAAPYILNPFTGLFEPPPKNSTTGVACVIIGGVAVVASIPLFIAASRNKYKARSLSFKYETAPQLVQNNIIRVPVPSITLKINL